MPSMAHIQRRRGVLRWTLENPEHHNQATWVSIDGSSSCGTTACIAGTAIMIYNHGLSWLDNINFTNNEELWEVYDQATTNIGEQLGASSSSSSEVAANLLGVAEDLASWLFLESSNEQAVKVLEFLASQNPDAWCTLTTLDDVKSAGLGIDFPEDEEEDEEYYEGDDYEDDEDY